MFTEVHGSGGGDDGAGTSSGSCTAGDDVGGGDGSDDEFDEEGGRDGDGNIYESADGDAGGAGSGAVESMGHLYLTGSLPHVPSDLVTQRRSTLAP